MPGDANEDGILNILDIVILVNAIVTPGWFENNPEEYESLVATMDLNEDGIINAVDVIILINALLGN